MIPYFTADEIEERRPIWMALSDLYLDTDVRLSYAFIARTSAGARFSIEELRAILFEEIAPVLEGNLLVVAGEWGCFDETWLVDRILKRQGRKGPVWLMVDIEEDWRCVAQLTRILRLLPMESRAPRSRAWQSLMPLFLDNGYLGRIFAPPPEFAIEDLETFFRNDLWPLLIEGCRKMSRQNPKLHPNELEIEANWLAFAAADR